MQDACGVEHIGLDVDDGIVFGRRGYLTVVVVVVWLVDVGVGGVSGVGHRRGHHDMCFEFLENTKRAWTYIEMPWDDYKFDWICLIWFSHIQSQINLH